YHRITDNTLLTRPLMQHQNLRPIRLPHPPKRSLRRQQHLANKQPPLRILRQHPDRMILIALNSKPFTRRLRHKRQQMATANRRQERFLRIHHVRLVDQAAGIRRHHLHATVERPGVTVLVLRDIPVQMNPVLRHANANPVDAVKSDSTFSAGAAYVQECKICLTRYGVMSGCLPCQARNSKTVRMAPSIFCTMPSRIRLPPCSPSTPSSDALMTLASIRMISMPSIQAISSGHWMARVRA